MKKIILIVIAVIVLAFLSLLFVTRTYFPDNIAETSPDGGTKDLKTRFYSADSEVVAIETKKQLLTLTSWGSNWKVVDETGGADSVQFKVEIPVVVFTDDMTVTIKEEDGSTRVDVKSQSRVGKSDIGENARNVRKLLNALDQKLK